MEPSSHARVYGPIQLLKEGNEYIKKYELTNRLHQCNSYFMGDRCNMVPQDQREVYLNR